jgi:hypothetical protein
MGFFEDVISCGIEIALLPALGFMFFLASVLYVLALALLPKTWMRVLWLFVVALIEWGRWSITPECVRRVAWPYLVAMATGAVVPFVTTTILVPYFLHPLHSYFRLRPIHTPPSDLTQIATSIPIIWLLWYFIYTALLSVRVQTACGSPPLQPVRGMTLASIMTGVYMFLLLGPLVYSLLVLVPIANFPYMKEIIISVSCGIVSMFWFLLYADSATIQNCNV